MREEYKRYSRLSEFNLKENARIQQGWQRTLDRVIRICENVDETLCNVLLAIRQNEYLQAWYPAQLGQKEQKVVGKYLMNAPVRTTEEADEKKMDRDGT